MPDVGLLSSKEPLSSDSKVVIKYSVEVDSLPVYTETYDAKKIEKELSQDRAAVEQNWFRRILCVVCCKTQGGFSACLTRCLTDGKCCKEGHEGCSDAG